jgi:hypothetical protein
MHVVVHYVLIMTLCLDHDAVYLTVKIKELILLRLAMNIKPYGRSMQKSIASNTYLVYDVCLSDLQKIWNGRSKITMKLDHMTKRHQIIHKGLTTSAQLDITVLKQFVLLVVLSLLGQNLTSLNESPTNILNFLGSVYPTQDSRPQYVCIDKACQLLRTASSNGSWHSWQQSTRFIVDSYHYTNHQASDILCRKWCNPAPTDGSAPNLVVVERDRTGKLYYKRAFNTQVCFCKLFEIFTNLVT